MWREDGKTEIAFVNGEQMDYLLSPAIALKTAGTICAVAVLTMFILLLGRG